MKVGIIGATGWMGRATGAALLDRGVVAPADLTLLNRGGPQAAYHGRTDIAWARDADDLARRSDVVIVAVRPDDWPGLGLRADGRLVLSYMAGVGLAALAECGGRVVRAMPNAAAELGACHAPWIAGPGVTDTDRDRVRRILRSLGTEDELHRESHIDLMTAAPGSGAAYPALLVMATADWLSGQGVPGPVAWRAAQGMVCGGARLLEGPADRAADLVAAYRAYGGTTAAGIDAARDAGLADAVAAGLTAANRRARQMG